MTTYIIDDELHSTDVLRLLIDKHCPQLVVKAILNDASIALSLIQQQPPELLFLDIEMPQLNGFDLLRQCAPVRFKVIFTTAYDQYAVRAFKFNALDYLLKPICPDDLKQAVTKATIPPTLAIQAADILKTNPIPKRIALPTGNELLIVEVDDIICCESSGSYVSVFLNSYPKPIVVTKSLREFEDILNNTAFFRAHNSHLVHLKYVRKINKSDGGELVMTNNRVIPVSRSKRMLLLEQIIKI